MTIICVAPVAILNRNSVECKQQIVISQINRVIWMYPLVNGTDRTGHRPILECHPK